MTIAINGRFVTQAMTGVQRFASEIVAALGAIAPGKIVVYTPSGTNAPATPGVEYRSVGRRAGHLWEQSDLPRALRADGAPPLVSLCNSGPLFYQPHYYTLHDITFRRYPKGFTRSFRFAYNRLTPALLHRANAVFTVSEFSADEISHEFGLLRDSVSVIYNAVAPTFLDQASSRAEDLIDPFFLAIGSIGSNKNLETLLGGYAAYRAGGGTARLVIVGPAAYAADAVPDGASFVGRIADDELSRRYAGAIAYVSASLYEGFSIPLIEAQASGCPVIASRIPVHEEVLGQSASLFSPRSTSELAALLRIASFGGMRDAASAGYANAARFSWEASARALLDAVQERL